MGFLDLFFKRKQKEEINYEEIIERCWNIFRQGLQNPNPEIRRAVEEAVWNIDTPEGKRFFAAGMQEPDINNKYFCLEKIYERGGWRLSENLIKGALNEEELDMSQRESLLYFIGGFSDPNAADFLPDGLNKEELSLRIATLCAISGIKSGQNADLVLKHLEKTENDLERFVAGMALYQYNKPEGKPIVDKAFSEVNSPNPEYIDKLRFLDFNKAQVYFSQFSESGTSEVKKKIIEMIGDNRGIELIKKFLQDPDPEVASKAMDQVIEIGSRSVLDIIKELKNNPRLEKQAKLVLAVFGDHETAKELEEKAKKGSLEEENLEDLRVLGLVHEQNVSAIIDKLLEPITNLDTISKDEAEKVNKAVQILIKYGKMSSIPVVSRYVQLSYLENEDINRWTVSCNSAAAVLCIVERNTTYYSLHKKHKEQGIKENN